MLEKLWKWLSARFAPHINQRGLSLLKESEGLRLFRYKDTNGKYKIGYGSPADDGPEAITSADASLLLLRTLRPIEVAIHQTVKAPLTADQFSALVCFAYNVGIGAFEFSSILKNLDQKKYREAADALLLYDHVNGVVNSGIKTRRDRERALFLSLPDPLPKEGWQ